MSNDITKLGSDLVRLEPGRVITITEVTDRVLEQIQELFEAGERFELTRVTESSQALGSKSDNGVIAIIPSSSGGLVHLNRLMGEIVDNPVLAEELFRGLNPVETYAERFAKAPRPILR